MQQSSLKVFEKLEVESEASCQSVGAVLVSIVQCLEESAHLSDGDCSLTRRLRESEALLLAVRAELLQVVGVVRHWALQVREAEGSSTSSFRDQSRISSHLLRSSVTLAFPARTILPIAVHSPFHPLLPLDCSADRCCSSPCCVQLVRVAGPLVLAVHLPSVGRLNPSVYRVWALSGR